MGSNPMLRRLLALMRKSTALSPFSLDHVDGFSTNPGTGTTFTFTGRSFGAAPTGSDVRYIVAQIGVVRGGPNTFGTVTIGGVTATQIDTTYSATNIIVGMFIAAVPTGTTGDVVVNVGSSSLCCSVALARMINPTSLTPADTANDTVSAVALTLDIPTGGKAIAFTQASDGVAMTWSNATEVYEVDARTNEWFSAAISSTAGTNVAVSATGAATSIVGMAASFS
jgi:hypothetical protein